TCGQGRDGGGGDDGELTPKNERPVYLGRDRGVSKPISRKGAGVEKKRSREFCGVKFPAQPLTIRVRQALALPTRRVGAKGGGLCKELRPSSAGFVYRRGRRWSRLRAACSRSSPTGARIPCATTHQTLIRQNPDEVTVRLTEPGLSREVLVDAVRASAEARNSTTPHHPKTFPGIYAHAEAVRALRDGAVPTAGGRSPRMASSICSMK